MRHCNLILLLEVRSQKQQKQMINILQTYLFKDQEIIQNARKVIGLAESEETTALFKTWPEIDAWIPSIQIGFEFHVRSVRTPFCFCFVLFFA